MMTKFLYKIRSLLFALAMGMLCSSSVFAANIIIQNADAAGVGFNDTTPASTVGGNTGTTLGQQRLNAFNYAASIWGATIPGNMTITVSAKWSALECTSNSAVLGSAGTVSLIRNFQNAPLSDTFYPVALANLITGSDLNTGAEISAQFNINLGTPGCLDNKPWYYGLDNGHTTNQINLVTVLLHEFGHGLGFTSFTDEETGVMASGFPGVYDRFLIDSTTGKHWPIMTDVERKASAINRNNLVWNGQQVVADAGILTGGKDSSGRPRLWAPSPVEPGSSVSHWARETSPNQLMEPNINHDLSHSVLTPQDLTYSLLKDLGWCRTCVPSTPLALPAAPANDLFASAQVISGCTGSVSGTNVGSKRETSEPRHDSATNPNAGAGSVWYSWQAPSSGLMTITTENSNFDTMLGVYTGNAVNGLTVVLQPDGTPARNDDIDPGVILSSRVTFNATAGTTYRIAVDGWGGARGLITLNWSEANCSTVAAPIVLTETGTSRAVAFDSVTQVKGPFTITGLFNFSADRLTRVMIHTSSLGQISFNDLTVRINGVPMTIETFGNLPGVPGASYITVRLSSTLPTGTLPLTVSVQGVTSNAATIDIVP
jgi:hypothetical protein